MNNDETTRAERWRISGGTAYELIEDEAVALNLKTGAYYKLNRVAARTLKHLEQTHELRDLTALLLGEFDVDRARLEADLAALLADFARYGLVVREP